MGLLVAAVQRLPYPIDVKNTSLFVEARYDVSDVHNPSIIRAVFLMIDAISTSEMSVNFYETTRF
jgi:hypothetical protein